MIARHIPGMDHFLLNSEPVGALGLGLLAGFLLLNIATFAFFAVHQSRQRAGTAALPEVLLLSLAALGGWPGAKLAQLTGRGEGLTDQFRSFLNMVSLPLMVIGGMLIYEVVDLSAAGGAVMGFIGQQTGTGPGSAEIQPSITSGKDSQASGAVAVTDEGQSTTVAAVDKVAGAAQDAVVLPKRFGPGSEGKPAKVGKTIKAKISN
jgi:uncharacterized membrane protein YsdA (DUF1294 family)